MVYRIILAIFVLPVLTVVSYAQQVASPENSRTDTTFTLEDCIRFAIANQPDVNKSLIDERIARANNAIALASWLPQVNATANLQHYFQTPSVFSTTTGAIVGSGVSNYSLPQVTATQTIFSPDVLLAARASKLNTQHARQQTAAVRINTVSLVSKAFYDLLLSVQQIEVYKEDTARLKKNLSDAYHRYVSGVADKVDYKQATIALNNSMSQLKNATEEAGSKFAALKRLMGYPIERSFAIRFDTVWMMQEIYADTMAVLQVEKRIEYQQLQTFRQIQRETTAYYQLGFLPSLSGFYNYVHEYEDNKFSELYGRAYPYSSAGLQLSIPLFTGFRRTENIRKARLEEQKTDWDEVNLKLAIYAEYRQALARYKSNLYELRAQAENVAMAREVYNVVKLQYSEGVKAYLDVIIAESDLQRSEINYLDALFHLMESKVDLAKAMGDISPEI